MIKLRLRRTGKTHIASYQIVAIRSQNARDAIYLEKVGHYFPSQNKYDLNKENVLKWLKCGAQPTAVVKKLLKKEKIWSVFQEEKKISAKKQKTTFSKINPIKKTTTKKTIKTLKKNKKA